MRWRPLFVTGLAVTLLLGGCIPKQTNTPPQPPTGVTAPAHPELVAPIESALQLLKRMSETKEIPAANAIFLEYRAEWAKIKPALEKVDPRKAQHLEDGAVELDLEFAKPPEEFRPWELEEEWWKLGRLLGDAATLLGAPIRAELVPVDPTANIPYNSEQRVEITLSDHKIEPAALTIPQHTKVTFVITNRGKELHEWELGHFGVEVEDIAPGETKELTLVLLDAGEWEMSCHIPGHYEVGMFGHITVTPAELKQ